MCRFVEMTINEGTPNEVVVVEMIDCKDPNCPSSDSNPGNQ